MKTRIQINIRGVVQGVGFRPFVYRIAECLKLNGYIRNSASGVTIEAEGDNELLEQFLFRIKEEKPPLASIHGMEFSYLDPLDYSEFKILPSVTDGESEALILPDIALCEDCRNELFDINDRRYLYPFINCTNCGPRFTIIESLPYDRSNTSMKSFAMCDECREEYEDPNNRRFHAQPIACPKCGPSVKLINKKGVIEAVGSKVFPETIRKITEGKIIALKGLGGYQLIADAENSEAVNLLRKRKLREKKPFAVMAADLPMAEVLCEIDELEKNILCSPESPIVLLKKKKDTQLSDSIAPGNPYLGLMLPYTPLHHILLKFLNKPVIATSGNIAEEPMCINEYEALSRLSGIADFFLIHNRNIVRAVDDSVVRVVKGREMMIRRARGYAPLPFFIKNSSDKKIAAVGAQLKNTFSISKGNNIFVSQHLGDLENTETEEYMKRTINDISKIYDVEADIIVHDLHPGYTSTRIAKELNTATTPVQHHHAHAAACYYENQIDGDCLAVCWDGTGYGTDDIIWGAEFFLFNGTEFKRAAHFKPFKVPGGDSAIKDIRRSAAGVLYNMYGENTLRKIKRIPLASYDNDFDALLTIIGKDINCFRTDSAGRLFDAVCWLLGLSNYSNFEGESAMKLEFSIDQGTTESYPFEIFPGEMLIADWYPLIEKLLNDIKENVFKGIIAAKFHNTLIRIIYTVSLMLNQKKVLLTGGCFQNMYLLNGAIDKLKGCGITPYWHQRIPANDGGISFGQAALISARLSKQMKSE